MTATDSLLMLGCDNPKLKAFLEKMGYQLFDGSKGEELVSVIGDNVIDLVVMDEDLEADAPEICSLIRGLDSTKEVPILFVSKDNGQVSEIKDREINGIQFLDAPCSAGSLVSKIATQLRVRKMKGASEDRASLSEINASLRELNGRFKKELEEARAIQQTLLPSRLPAVKGMDIAASYEPLEEVGGDWFYVERMKDGKISVQIADVTGHGLSAAFIGSMTKLALTAANNADKVLPHDLMQEMNALMAPQMPEGKFVTMFSYLYDPVTGHLDYARAGHPPALHFHRKSGEVRQLMGEGFAVGFFEEAEYTHETTEIEVGDILLVMTDALPETQNMKGEYYGFDRMSELLAQIPEDRSSSLVISSVIKDFEKFREGRILKDDVTLIVLRRT